VIPLQLIRLTKKAAVLGAAGTVMFLLGVSCAHAACGYEPEPRRGLEQRDTIPLQDLAANGPVYYWHDSSTYALLYFRPEDLVAHLRALLAKEQGSNRDSSFGNATLLPALLDNIQGDLPLRESTDLFRYSMIDPRFDAVVNVVIADLMKEGKVMLDQWLLVEQQAKSIVMVSRADANGEEGGRWFCTAKDDVLFRIGPAAGD
jgi:hypothetical protein